MKKKKKKHTFILPLKLQLWITLLFFTASTAGVTLLCALHPFSKTILIISGIIILIGILLIWLMYQPLISSLKQLTRYMQDITNGDLKAQKAGAMLDPGLICSTEIMQITEALNDMLRHITDLNHTIFETYTRMYELDANNRKTEIAYLRSQVNPHFLYNTLTMICGMAAEGSTDNIISVAGSLSQIFRYSIKGNDMVTLREEMEIVKAYLMIQKERFGDRFSIRYTFEENCMDFMIPKMVIQPLVENAIVHGLEKSLKPGSLMIGAGRNVEHSYLAIWIYDTGIGMSPEKLKELRESLSHVDTDSTNNIGLHNVNSRMLLYFGNNYNLLLDSEEGVGTNVQIRVPYQT